MIKNPTLHMDKCPTCGYDSKIKGGVTVRRCEKCGILHCCYCNRGYGGGCPGCGHHTY